MTIKLTQYAVGGKIVAQATVNTLPEAYAFLDSLVAADNVKIADIRRRYQEDSTVLNTDLEPDNGFEHQENPPDA